MTVTEYIGQEKNIRKRNDQNIRNHFFIFFISLPTEFFFAETPSFLSAGHGNIVRPFAVLPFDFSFFDDILLSTTN